MNSRRTFSLSLRCRIVIATWFAISLSSFAQSVGLSWDPNSESNLAGYRVYCGTSPGQYSHVSNVSLSTYAHWENLTPSTTYYFVVKAYNTSGLESDPSNELSYTVPSGETDVIIVPQAPNLAFTVLEDQSISFQLYSSQGTSGDQSGSLTYSTATGPSHGSLTGTPPNLTYTPAPDFHGTDSFSYQVTANGVSSSPGRVDINVTPVNDRPTAIAGSGTTLEDTPMPITLTGSDPDSASLTYVVTRQPSKGTLSGNAPFLTYTPNPNYAGIDTLEFTVSDGQLTSDPATFFISISPINDPPAAFNQSLSVVAGSTTSVLLRGSDPEGSPLTFRVISNPNVGTLGGISPNLTFTVPSSASGTTSFQFEANDGVLASSPATVTIQITPSSNTAPIATPQSRSLAEDGTLSITLAGSDADGNSLTYQIVRPPANGSLSGSAPTLTYRPNLNYNGTDFFEFTVNDGRVSSAPARVSLTITAVNDAPTAIAQTVTVPEDSSLPITLTGADAEGSPITFAISQAPTKGRLLGTAPNLLYVPNSNFNGVDTFKFTTKDGSLTSTAGTVTINVTSVNDLPRPTPRTLTVLEDKPITISLSATDVDQDSLTYAISSQPLNGQLSGSGRTYIYSPNANYNGPDEFLFTVTDGKSAPVEAKISLNISAVNDTPVATGTALTLNEDTSLPFTLQATDVENSPLTFTIKTRPANGTLSGSAPNLTYTPNLNFSGSDSLKFTAKDGSLESSIVTVTFQVTAVNDAPTAISKTVSTAYNTSVAIVLSATDAEGNALTYRVSRAPTRGTLSGTAPNLSYRPTSGLTGTDSFEFTASDASLTSAPAQITINVGSSSSVLDAQPDALLVSASGFTSSLMDGSTSVSSNDGVPEGTQVRLVQAPTRGLVQLAADGTFQYFHGGGPDNSDAFTYVTVNDGVESAPTTVTVHVFRATSIRRDGDNAVLSFPVAAGVTYKVEGSVASNGSPSDWQTLGELSPESTTSVDVPTPAPADGSQRYFRITATNANGTLTSEILGFQRFQLQAGAQTYSPGFQGRLVGTCTVSQIRGSEVVVEGGSFLSGASGSTGFFASHIAVIAGGSQWWPIVGSSADSITLDSPDASLDSVLAAGERLEIIELPTAAQTFGSSGSGESALQDGDFVDFVNGNGTVSTLEARSSGGTVTWFLQQTGGASVPVDTAAITLLPGQPIQVQKAEGTGTAWFIGRLQSSSLTPRLMGGTTTTAQTTQ